MRGTVGISGIWHAGEKGNNKDWFQDDLLSSPVKQHEIQSCVQVLPVEYRTKLSSMDSNAATEAIVFYINFRKFMSLCTSSTKDQVLLSIGTPSEQLLKTLGQTKLAFCQLATQGFSSRIQASSSPTPMPVDPRVTAAVSAIVDPDYEWVLFSDASNRDRAFTVGWIIAHRGIVVAIGSQQTESSLLSVPEMEAYGVLKVIENWKKLLSGQNASTACALVMMDNFYPIDRRYQFKNVTLRKIGSEENPAHYIARLGYQHGAYIPVETIMEALKSMEVCVDGKDVIHQAMLEGRIHLANSIHSHLEDLINQASAISGLLDATPGIRSALNDEKVEEAFNALQAMFTRLED